MNTNTYSVLLKLVALVCLVPPLLHGVFGIAAENFLLADAPRAALVNPNLDSQSRFYGLMFALFPICLWLASTDLGRYRRLLACALAVFFLAGLSRLLSWWWLGAPSMPIQVLGALELVGPPIFWFLQPKPTDSLS